MPLNVSTNHFMTTPTKTGQRQTTEVKHCIKILIDSKLHIRVSDANNTYKLRKNNIVSHRMK